MLCRQSSQCGQARLAELDQHCQVGLLPGVVFRDVMPAHAGDRAALRRNWEAARAGGDRRWLRYILKADGRPPQRERPPALEAVADWVRAFSNPEIALNADFYASTLAANTENT